MRKRVIIYLAMLCSGVSFCQSSGPTFHGPNLKDRETLAKILSEFNEDARREGIYIDHYISQDLGGIKILPQSDIKELRPDVDFTIAALVYREETTDLMGFWHTTPYIAISDHVMEYDYEAIKLILYHELGHFFYLGHIKGGGHIMSPATTNQDSIDNFGEPAMKDFWAKVDSNSYREHWKRNSNNR